MAFTNEANERSAQEVMANPLTIPEPRFEEGLAISGQAMQE